jgi:hypothetical protein
MAILSALATEVFIPVAAVIGIAFAVVQWVLVSRVKLSPAAAASGGSKNGYGDYLIEEEEGLNDHNVVVKCAEIQTAISEGEAGDSSDLGLPLSSLRSAHFMLLWRVCQQRFTFLVDAVFSRSGLFFCYPFVYLVDFTLMAVKFLSLGWVLG